MMKIDKNKLVLFGAGKIGRSFIGQLFSTGGYEVVFIDIYRPVIDELNRRKNYDVVAISEEGEQVIHIKNVRGIYAGDSQQVADEVASAGILAVSVGVNALPSIFPLLAEGVKKRFDNTGDSPLDIIIAENMANATSYFREQLPKYFPAGFPITRFLGFIETSIGKMVPIVPEESRREDPLRIFAEPYNTLILDRIAFKNPIPKINGLAPKDNIKAWVDRKLFIHNLGHAATAYIGYVHNPSLTYVFEVLEVPEVYVQVKGAMLQAACILRGKHPGEFTEAEMGRHIDDLLARFRNKALKDTIYRVGCDLKRKLAEDGRLAGPVKAALTLNLPYDKILYAIAFGCHFRAKDADGHRLEADINFITTYNGRLSEVLAKICGFGKGDYPDLFRKAEILNRSRSSNSGANQINKQGENETMRNF
jgi:mannitol-1-phosphate 5-dehydrogenase